MTEEQVWDIWTRTIGRIKERLKDGVLTPDKHGAFPELWPGYNVSRRNRKEIGVHVTPGEFPDHLFKAKAPNQTDKEMDWMEANYKQVTMPVYLDLENTVGRAKHHRNYSMDFAEDPASQGVHKYITEDVREWGSVENFFRFALTRIKIPDPMGVLVVAPTSLDTDTVLNDEGIEEMRMTPGAEVKPDLTYFPCDDLWGFAYDKWYLLRRPEMLSLKEGRQTRDVGVLCWLVDEEWVWQIEQYGKPSEYTFRLVQWYRHGLGYPPCINLLGTPRPVNGRLLWESPYIAVKDVLDTALLGEHWLRASEAKCTFPNVVVVGSPCQHKDANTGACCNGIGLLSWMERDVERSMTCPSCNGTGITARLSPLGQVVINPGSDIGGGESVNATNALKIVSPETAAVEYLQQQFDRRIRYARSIMHLDAEAPMTGGDAKTATEAGLNARAKDAFVKPIADQEFFILRFVVECIGKQIVGPSWDGFSLRAPSSYDLRTDADHMAEIAVAMEKGLPPAIVDYMVWEYITARYQNDPKALDAFEVITKADRLQGMGALVLQAEAAAGRAQPWEIYLHYAGMLLYEQLAQDAAFMALSTAEKVERMKAAAMVAAPPSATTNPLMRIAERVTSA